MMRALLSCLLLSTVLAPFQLLAEAVPEWIWTSAAAKTETIYARRVWTLSEKPKSATLSITCDNGFVAFLNGKKIGSGSEWSNHYQFDIVKPLRKGDNVLAVEASNEGSKAGLVAKVSMKLGDDKATTIVSDTEWLVSSDKQSGWKAPSVDTGGWSKPVIVGKMGDSPWGNVFSKSKSAADVAVANSAAKVHPEGFKVEKIYDVPKGEQGSWVAMAIDDQGRLYCSDQGDKGLYRVIPGKEGESPKVEKLNLEISGAQGLLWAFDSLYVCVNGGGVAGRGSGLYRVTDSDGDGELDKIVSLRKMAGGGEHGPHAVVLSPDGRSLFVLGGNHTKPPAPETTAVIPNYDEDQLLPRMPDARGHAANIRAPGGWIAQTDPDGESWHFFCSGFRNQYDIAFNADGEMFTYDSDMEWDSGLPWYRPTRIYHCTSGAEFGWRTGTGKWPAWYPDALPPAIDIGPGCPTGVMSGKGAKFPSKYQDAIYAFDWTYGTIYAIHLERDGASYLAEKEEFVTGVPLNVTDGVIGKDGHFYFAVGGRGTPSALYRVSYHGDASTAVPKPSTEGADERALRRQLERFHGAPNAEAISAVWPHLGHADRFIRYAARTAIEHQPVAQWRDRALSESDTAAALTALLALARQGEASDQASLLESLSQLSVGEMNEVQKLEALRVLSLCFIRMGRPEDSVAEEVVQALLPLYPAPSDALNRELVAMLVYLNAPEAVTRTVPLLSQDAASAEEIEFDDNLLKRSKGYGGSFLNQKAANPQRQQIHYVYALKNASEGWTPKLRREFFTWFAKARNFKGGASFEGFLNNFRKEALAKIEDPAEREAMDKLSQEPVRLVPEGFENVRQETIGMLANMKFNRETMSAKAGSKLALSVVNDDPMKLMHNLAVVEPGSLEKVLQASIALGPEAMESDFVPDIPEVLASTPQIAPGRKYVLYFDVPKEPGEYPYVCTYPGHGQLMRGVLTVIE